MKRKALTIGLIVLVCTIWGAVLSKAVDRRASDTAHTMDLGEATDELPHFDSIPATSSLGRYRDPFLGSGAIVRAPVSTTIAASHVPAVVRTTPPVIATRSWPRITYVGSVRKTNEDRAVALLTVDEKQTLLLQGAEENGLRAVLVRPDSVVLAFDGEKRTFRR